MNYITPDSNCSLCPRLLAFREKNRLAHPSFHNAPVPSFIGSEAPSLLIVGLAPGLRGANCTGRPFTNDYAGDLLYSTLTQFGFAEGSYQRHAQDGLRLIECRVTNAVRCVPPENKPTPDEINTCNAFLKQEIGHLPSLRAIVALGTISHQSVLKALGHKKSAYAFRHGAEHDLPSGVRLFNSYHCSRYNTNTGRLTEAMFHSIFKSVRAHLKKA